MQKVINAIKATAETIEIVNSIAQQIKKLAMMFDKQKADLKAKGPMLMASHSSHQNNKDGNQGWFEQLTNPRHDEAPDKLESITRVVELMMASGADLNATDKNGETLLHKLAVNGSKEAVMALIAAGADVNIADSQQQTALDKANAHNNTDIANALMAGHKVLGQTLAFKELRHDDNYRFRNMVTTPSPKPLAI